jgi:hypothetical protein
VLVCAERVAQNNTKKTVIFVIFMITMILTENKCKESKKIKANKQSSGKNVRPNKDV